MRFYLVDRILEVVPGQRIRGLKLVSTHDPVLEQSPTAGAVLAPSLVVESLAQTSAWLILATTGFRQRGVLAGLRDIQIGSPAPLGCRLDVVSTVDSWSDEAVVFATEASLDGELVLSIAGAMCFLIAADELEDPRQTEAHYRALCGAGDSVLDAPRQPHIVTPSSPPQWLPYDSAIDLTVDREASALKWVVMADPVFATHFPRFPVMPGVLVLQSITDVARRLLYASSENGATWRLRRIQGARFRRYVRPGDQLVLRARIRDIGSGEASLTGSAEVAGTGVVALRQIIFSREDGASPA